MVVTIVNKNGVAIIIKAKCHAPVTVNRHRPNTGFIALQWMKVPAWCAHIRRFFSLTERKQLPAQSRRVSCLYTSGGTRPIKFLQPFVLKALDHKLIRRLSVVTLYATRCEAIKGRSAIGQQCSQGAAILPPLPNYRHKKTALRRSRNYCTLR